MLTLAVGVACAVCPSLAQAQYPQQTNMYGLSGSVSPSEAGSPGRPVPVGASYSVQVNEANGLNPAAVKDWSLRVDGLSLNAQVAPACPASSFAAYAGNSCPSGSLVGTGFVRGVVYPLYDPGSRNVILCEKQVGLYNSGPGKAILYLYGPGSQCAGVGQSFVIPVAYSQEAGQLTLNIRMPDNVLHPIPGLTFAVSLLSLDVAKTTGQVAGAKRGYFEAVGGCVNGRRSMSAVLTAENGQYGPAATDVGCTPNVPYALSTDPSSPGSATNVRVKGQADPGSTVRLYKTADCSGTVVKEGTVAEFASPGFQVTVPARSTTTFYATATDTLDPPNTSACSPGATYTQRPTPPPPRCNVPQLRGKRPAGAKTVLSRAHCALGKVTQPRARKGHKPPRLVVVSQSPRALSVRPAGTKVALRLGPALHPTFGSGAPGSARRPRITVRALHGGCLHAHHRGHFALFRITGHDVGHVRGFRVKLDGRLIVVTSRRSFRLTLDALKLKPGRHELRITATGQDGRHRLRKVEFRRC